MFSIYPNPVIFGLLPLCMSPFKFVLLLWIRAFVSLHATIVSQGLSHFVFFIEVTSSRGHHYTSNRLLFFIYWLKILPHKLLRLSEMALEKWLAVCWMFFIFMVWINVKISSILAILTIETHLLKWVLDFTWPIIARLQRIRINYMLNYLSDIASWRCTHYQEKIWTEPAYDL